MPPFSIFLSVEIEETLKPVVIEIKWAKTIIRTTCIIPEELPTTLPKRIYIITPRIVSKEGVKTPLNVPNFFCVAIKSIRYNY